MYKINNDMIKKKVIWAIDIIKCINSDNVIKYYSTQNNKLFTKLLATLVWQTTDTKSSAFVQLG